MTEPPFDRKVFSFNKEFNQLKGIGKTEKMFDPDPYCDLSFEKAKIRWFFNWAISNGGYIGPILYPVSFGTDFAQYIGAMATQDIGPNTVLTKTPYKLLITAYNGFTHPILRPIIEQHSHLFDKSNVDGEDNIMCMFLMYEFQKGDESFWHPWFEILPKAEDLLWKWPTEDL